MGFEAPQDEELVRKIIESVYAELGENADTEKVKKVVRKTLDEIENSHRNAPSPTPESGSAPSIAMNSSRVIVTAFGINQPGMVAAISGVLAQNRCNIVDISQKILQDYFTLILIVDIKDCPISLRELKDQFGNIGNKLGIKVLTQHEDVFNYMHRL